MGSRILEPEEMASLSPINWHRMDVHLEGNGQGDCNSADGEASERAAARIRDLEQLLETRALEAEKAVKEAQASGLREGEQRGRTQAAGEMRATLDRLSQTIAEAATLRAQLRKEAEAELVNLALGVARRILHREVTLHADAIQGIVAVALSKLQAQETCRVRVHPQHAAPVKTALERIAPGSRIEVSGDASLTPGDVVLDCQRGRLDASVDSQLAEIERGLADRIGES